MAGKILVVGSTGTVGRALVEELGKRGERIRAATREPESAAGRAGFGPGVDVVRFDLERPETFDAALLAVERVFLIARPGDEHSDRLAIPLIEAMERHGVRHVVDLSAMGAEQRPEFALRKVELRLEASPMTFTHLRPNWFMQVWTGGPLLAAIRATRRIGLPAGDAKIMWIDGRDVAEVAAVALTGGPHERTAYTLTGEEPLDHAEAATAIAAASGAPVHYDAIDEDEARRVLGAAGLPPPWVERLIGFYRLVRAGHCAPVSPAVRELLGRPARRFEAFAREHAAIWRT